MNVVVTTNKIEYSNFIKVKSLQEVEAVVGSIDYLVYHKSDETRDEIVELLSKLKDVARVLVYIRDKNMAEQAIQIVVVGSGGRYFDDEFFMESSEELNSLIKNFDTVTDIVELGGVNVLSDFFTRYLNGGSSDFNKSYLKVVKEAVRGMIADYKAKDLQLLQLSETATEIFAHSSEIISGIEGEREKLQEMLTKAQAEHQTSKATSFMGVPSVLFFPRVSYPKEKMIIRIKDIGGCIFLTSFMMGFRLYLERIKNVRPKLIFVESVGNQYETKYKEYKWVTQKTCRSMGNYYNPVVFTNYPIKDVLNRLLDDTDYDTFIVVDKLRNSKDHILNSKGPVVKYAVSGASIIDKFKLKKLECFTTIHSINGTLFTLPVFPEYPSDSTQRERMYLRTCTQYFDTLYSTKG